MASGRGYNGRNNKIWHPTPLTVGMIGTKHILAPTPKYFVSIASSSVQNSLINCDYTYFNGEPSTSFAALIFSNKIRVSRDVSFRKLKRPV